MTQAFDPTPAQPQSTSDFTAQTNQALAVAALTRRVTGGASNFFWIAGLSVINSVLAVVGSNTRFVVGLGITQFIDAIAQLVGQDAPQTKTVITIIAILIDLVVVGIFAFFGYFAGKGRRWAFITGMILYAFDTLIMLAFQDWLALGFHIFFLFGLFKGLQALNQLQKITMPKPAPDFPQNIGVS